MLHVAHVTDKIIIAHEIDGVSRGDMQKGYLSKNPVIFFPPLQFDAIERSCLLKYWLKSWLGLNSFFLTPKNWFCKAHDVRYFSNEKERRDLSY